MTSAIESSAIAPAASVVESIASPDAIPVDNNAAAPLEQASEQASNALEQPVASTETTSESKAPEEPHAASNEPALVASNEPAPAASNEPALVASNEPAPAVSNEPALVASNEAAPAPAASNEPAPSASNEPAPSASNEPALIASNEPAPAASNEPALVASNEAAPAPAASNEPAPAADSKDSAPAPDFKDDKMDETAASNLIETEKALDQPVASVDDSMAVDQVPSPTSSVEPAAISKAGTPDKSQVEEEVAPTKGGKRAGKKATAEPAAKKTKA